PPAGIDRLERVLHQVHQRLTHLGAIGGELDLARRWFDREASRGGLARVQRREIGEQLPGVAALEPGRRQASEVGELLEQALQRLDLLADGARRLLEDRGEVGTLLLPAASQVVDRDRDRGERVLHLVRHHARHLAPRRPPLARDQALAVAAQVQAHAVEGVDQGLQLAHAAYRERLVPLAARELLGVRGDAPDRTRHLARPPHPEPYR